MLVLRKLTATDDGIKKANQDGRQSNLCAGVREVGGVLRADIIDREAKVLPYFKDNNNHMEVLPPKSPGTYCTVLGRQYWCLFACRYVKAYVYESERRLL